jgi:ribosome biogenesis GTPase
LVDGIKPARVVAQHRGGYTVRDDEGDRTVVLAGALRHAGAEPPAVGDLAEVSGERIVRVLPRRGVIARAGQVLAANVDMAWIVTGLGRDVNPRRLERYLSLAAAGDVEPLVLLTKTDLPDVPLEAALGELRAVAGGAPVLPISARTGVGVDSLAAMLAPDRTAVLLGSSGAGKSTLANALLGGDHLATAVVREDDERGRHTTTHRELFELPGGGALIDTPGLRAVGVTDAPDGAGGPFADIAELARGCRFSDCTHTSEPGCAVNAAVEAGDLDPARLAAYQELVAEGHREREQADARARSEKERAGRTGARALRRLYNDRDSGRKR